MGGVAKTPLETLLPLIPVGENLLTEGLSDDYLVVGGVGILFIWKRIA
jgi:hypothetical protein